MGSHTFSIAPYIVIALPTIAIDGRAITLQREPSKKKQRTYTKKDEKRIKSDNFTWINREKSNIAIASILVEAIIFSSTIPRLI